MGVAQWVESLYIIMEARRAEVSKELERRSERSVDATFGSMHRCTGRALVCVLFYVIILFTDSGGRSSMVEHWFVVPVVVGSSPIAHPRENFCTRSGGRIFSVVG